MIDSHKKKFKTLAKFLVSVLGLAFIFHKVPFQDVYDKWHVSMLPWVLAMLICTQISMMIQANRWKGLSITGPSIPFRTYYAYIVLGYFFNSILPSGVGGDAVKSIAFGKRFHQTSQSVAAVLLSRIQGLLVLFLLFFIALPFVLSKYAIPLIYSVSMIGACALCLLLIVACLFSDKISIFLPLRKRIPFLEKLQASFSLYRSCPKQLWLSSLDSLWLQLLSMATHYFYFRAVGFQINIATVVVFPAITVIVTMLPIAFNGVGIREWMQVTLYSGILGMDASLVLAASLLGYILLLFQVIQGAIVLTQMKLSAVS
jgi:hypothetical protein